MAKIPECPNCKSTDDIRYIEDIQNWRKVVNTEGDTLQVAAHYEIGEGWDDGSNGRLFCGACCQEFPIPEGLDVDFLASDEVEFLYDDEEEDGEDEVEL